MTLFIMLNLGLGDAIIANGLVRELAKQYERVFLPSYVSNGPSVGFMFDDLENVLIQEIYGPNEIYTLEREHISHSRQILRLGTYNSEPYKEPETFDQTFYRQAGIDFSKRWDGFKLPEKIVDYGIPKDPYIVICDDDFRGFNIDDSKLRTDLVKVRLWKSETIFDFIPLFSKAEEVHAIDSAPKHLIESIPMQAKLFYHLYSRNAGPYHQAKMRKTWKILD